MKIPPRKGGFLSKQKPERLGQSVRALLLLSRLKTSGKAIRLNLRLFTFGFIWVDKQMVKHMANEWSPDF